MEWKKAIEENIKTGLHDLMVLKLLSKGDRYGYEIRKLISLGTNKAFKYETYALYSILYRLESRGLISCYTEAFKEKSFRKYYHIEKSGEEYLAYGEEQSRVIFDGYLNLMDQ